MASLQSYIFRVLTKTISHRLHAISSISKLRSFSENISRLLPMPLGVATRTVLLNGIPVEWIEPRSAASSSVIIYLHGGAWVLGWYQNHRVLTARIGQATGSRMLAVDYRLSPEHPFPAALDDCLAVYQGLLQGGFLPEQIVLAGDSAGANLALAAMISLRDSGKPLPVAAVCISPVSDLTENSDAFSNKRDALLSSEFAYVMSRHYIQRINPEQPLISPRYGDLAGLPPLLIQIGKEEILLDDARGLHERAVKAGLDVSFTIWPGMWHVWHLYAPFLPEARLAIAEIGSFVRRYMSTADRH